MLLRTIVYCGVKAAAVVVAVVALFKLKAKLLGIKPNVAVVVGVLAVVVVASCNETKQKIVEDKWLKYQQKNTNKIIIIKNKQKTCCYCFI